MPEFFKGLVEEALRSDLVASKEKKEMVDILKRHQESLQEEEPLDL